MTDSELIEAAARAIVEADGPDIGARFPGEHEARAALAAVTPEIRRRMLGYVAARLRGMASEPRRVLAMRSLCEAAEELEFEATPEPTRGADPYTSEREAGERAYRAKVAAS